MILLVQRNTPLVGGLTSVTTLSVGIYPPLCGYNLNTSPASRLINLAVDMALRPVHDPQNRYNRQIWQDRHDRPDRRSHTPPSGYSDQFP